MAHVKGISVYYIVDDKCMDSKLGIVVEERRPLTKQTRILGRNLSDSKTTIIDMVVPCEMLLSSIHVQFALSSLDHPVMIG